ncbi:hypothetical protein MHI48_09475 [Paenibacillus sp. FSL H7-0942]|uniref:hypothetical protein n=1 Tax=Paenibacillus TaxID=44249 RepID=UPI00096ED47A|nr:MULTISPECIES: hypothetical protein [Paenibacillus]MCF7755573.1 hypothetical protein [Paenibacillus xylanexedens]OME99565.1 hypothetical protein BK124_08200 [Paenibacillus amylolyticus]OMF09846.1 hypothetical protein BK129_03140 [Paenibacillus amylolyticus]PKQ92720.1 hypothetical protein CXK86_00955 [Paenibacillus sp. BGI2013]
MKETLSNQEDIGFLFNVDILIKSRSNALALQSLLEFINNEEQIADFRIQSGIELGKIIEATLQSKKDSFVTLHNERKKANAAQKASTAAQTPASPAPVKTQNLQEQPVSEKKPATQTSNVSDGNSFDAWIDTLIKENKLTRIVVNNKNGKHQSIPCRILNFDRDTSIVSIYHVDEKQVYTFRTNEIDEFL